jgi:RNA polymerase sigma-70 factor (ECF subfamily)
MVVDAKKTTDPARTRSGMDRAEFAEKYESLYAQLWLTAAGILGHRNEAEDIVQEAAIVAYRKQDDFRPGTNFAAWVTGIVKHCALNHRRKTAGRRTFPTDPQTLDQERGHTLAGGSVDTSGGLTALSHEFDDDMIRVLGQLSPEARCCLLLRIVDGLSYAEISRFLDIPQGTAMSHVHRSKQLMRSQLAANRPSRKEVDG